MPNEVILRHAGTRPTLHGQDHVWTVIRRLGRSGAPFTVDDVRGRSNDPRRSSIAEYMARLEKARFIERCGKMPGAEPGRRRNCYRLLKHQVETPAVDRQGNRRPRVSGRQSMWNVMRGPIGRAGFTIRELVAGASTETAPVGPAGAQTYVSILARAGYLMKLPKQGRHAVWRLKPSRNTGPRAPRALARGGIYDQNLQEVVAVEVPS